MKFTSKFIPRRLTSAYYLIVEKGTSRYYGRDVLSIKVKEYIRKRNIAVGKEHLLLFPYETMYHQMEINVGEIVRIGARQFDWSDRRLYVANAHLTSLKSKVPEKPVFVHSKKQVSKDRVSRPEQLPVPPADDKLPNISRCALSWENVLFQNGYIFFSSPYKSDGGLGKRVTWEDCTKEYEQIKPALSKIVPVIHVEISNGCVKEVYNYEKIIKAVINLSKPVEKAPPMIIRKRNLPSIGVLPLPKRMNINDVRNIPEAKSSRYIKELCRLHLSNYSVYYCTERKSTKSGTASPEKAFIFCLKVTPDRLLIIYENTIESRSSYLFVINRTGYVGIIQQIHRFFASDASNKRQDLARNNIEFPKEKIYSYYRIIHNSFLQWCDDLRGYILQL